jgi:DNA-binding transcriptional LysR family regulator
MDGTIDLNHLAVFAAVAETRGFSSAARKLSLPKSTVSRSISVLESCLGVRLLHRTTRRVSMTTAGSELHGRIAPLLASLLQSADKLAQGRDQPAGLLRVTASVDFGSAVLAEIVARFVARHPEVSVDMHLSNEVLDLEARGFDVALRLSGKRLADSSLSARKAGRITLQLFASPAYLARRGTPRLPGDLADHEHVVHRTSSIVLDGPSGPVKVALRGRIRCDDMLFARAALRAGAGIGVLPSFLAQRDCSAGDLVRVLPRWVVPSGEIWVVWPGGKDVPAKVTAFRQFVLEALGAEPA